MNSKRLTVHHEANNVWCNMYISFENTLWNQMFQLIEVGVQPPSDEYSIKVSSPWPLKGRKLI